MNGLKRLIEEIHRRSLWQVLAIYGVASWVVFEVVQTVTEGLGLPTWFPAFAALLLLIGLPIVLATAFVQEGISPMRRVDPTLMAGAELESDAEPGEVGGARLLLTWRNAISGGVLALALWGVVAGGWLLLHDRDEGPAEESRSVAVLPFDNIGADPENEYFSDGITEDIITQLSKISGLKVISRTSVMQYKGVRKSIREIGEELGVTSILEGSVRRADRRVRVTAQLIDARSDEHLWAENYDRELADIFAIQSDLAGRIAAALGGALGASDGRPTPSQTQDLEAYQLYLKGRFFWNKRTEESLRRSIEFFQQALDIDPVFAPAYAGMADANLLLPIYSATPAGPALTQARSAANRALELDPGLAEPHTTLGFATFWAREWAEAEREFRRAIELQPGYATAHQWYSILLAALARHDEALEEMSRAHELDPLSLIINDDLAMVHFFARRHDQAIEQYRRTIELDSRFPPAYRRSALAYMQTGRDDEAVEMYERWNVLRGKQFFREGELQEAFATGGREGAYRMLIEASQETGFSSVERAYWHAVMGDTDQAFRELGRGLESNDLWVFFLNVHPLLDQLRDDPRFDDLLARMDLH